MYIGKIFPTAILALVLVLALITHALNFLRYPYFESDEGTYLSQAFSLITSGQLSPYTYTYDHAPGGWIFLSLWVLLTGGFFTFGSALFTGRIFILVLHLLSALLIYLFTLKITKHWFPSAIAALAFSFSPLAIFYQRRLLLDNIMVFWLLLSFYLAVQTRTIFIAASALAFSVALVTKETAVFFLPAVLYLLLFFHRQQQSSKLILFLLLSFLFPLIYIIYALMRGEFFPYGIALGGSYPHTSLLGTLLEQLNRAPVSPITQVLSYWFRQDPFLIILFLFSILGHIYFISRHHLSRFVLFSIIPYFIFLIRGGIVLEFYFLPLVPFLSISLASLIFFLLKDRLLPAFIAGFLFLLFNLFYFGSKSLGDQNLYSSNQTEPQLQAINWINSRVGQYFYLIDNYAYVDLYGRNTQNSTFHSYWKIDRDPAVAASINNDPNNIDFIMVTPQTQTDLANNDLTLTKQALDRSSRFLEYSNSRWSVYIYQNNHSYKLK